MDRRFYLKTRKHQTYIDWVGTFGVLNNVEKNVQNTAFILRYVIDLHVPRRLIEPNWQVIPDTLLE